jgi:hypothetical protein
VTSPFSRLKTRMCILSLYFYIFIFILFSFCVCTSPVGEGRLSPQGCGVGDGYGGRQYKSEPVRFHAGSMSLLPDSPPKTPIPVSLCNNGYLGCFL